MNKELYSEIVRKISDIISVQEYSKINVLVKEYLSNNRTLSGFKTVYRALFDSCASNAKLYSLKTWAITEFNKLYKDINYDLIKNDSFELETVLLMGNEKFDKSILDEKVKKNEEPPMIPLEEPKKSYTPIIPLEEIEVSPVVDAEPVVETEKPIVNINEEHIELKDLAVNAAGTLANDLELERVLESIKDKRDFVDVNMVVSADEIYNTKGIRTKDAKSRIARISKDTLNDIVTNVNYIIEKKKSLKDKIKVVSKDELENIKRFLKISDTFNLFEEKVNNIFAIRQERLRMKQNEPIGYVDASLDKMKTI